MPSHKMLRLTMAGNVMSWLSSEILLMASWIVTTIVMIYLRQGTTFFMRPLIGDIQDSLWHNAISDGSDGSDINVI